MKRIALALCGFLSLSAVAFAHDGNEHVRGSVTQVTSGAITVQTTGKQAKTETITLLPGTTFVKGKAAATLKDVNVGDKVVIDVVMKGHEMTAKSVTLGAAPAAKAGAAHEHPK